MHDLLNRSGAEVEFHYLREGVPLLMVQAKVNGQGPYDFIVDTGNGLMGLAVSPDVAEELNIATHVESLESKFPIGLSKSLSVGKIDSFELGGVRVGAADVGVLPALSELGARLKAPIDGNIGYHFLKEYAVTLDFAHSTLTLSRESPTGSSVTIDLGENKPLVVIDVEANGVPLRFVLDTGASYCCISPNAAERLGLERGAEFPVNGSATEKAYTCKLDTLTVAGRTQATVGIAVADFVDDLCGLTGTHIDGVLGYSFWSKYRLTIDYPSKRLFLADR